MKITVTVDENLSEETADFNLREMTPQLQVLITQLQNLDFKLIVTREEKKYQLAFDDITTLYAGNKRVYILMDDKQEFSMTTLSLSALADKLPVNFIRISNSEIVNAQKIKYFEFTFGGRIKINFANGHYAYSSRSYLKKIKEYFGL